MSSWESRTCFWPPSARDWMRSLGFLLLPVTDGILVPGTDRAPAWPFLAAPACSRYCFLQPLLSGQWPRCQPLSESVNPFAQGRADLGRSPHTAWFFISFLVGLAHWNVPGPWDPGWFRVGYTGNISWMNAPGENEWGLLSIYLSIYRSIIYLPILTWKHHNQMSKIWLKKSMSVSDGIRAVCTQYRSSRCWC